MTLDDDVARLARGQEVRKARAVLDEHCNKRRSATIDKIVKSIRDPESGPLRGEQAIQAWLDIYAIESLRIDLERQIKDGERAGTRVAKASD